MASSKKLKLHEKCLASLPEIMKFEMQKDDKQLHKLS